MSLKLHETEENWAGGAWGAHPKFVQVDPPLDKKSVWVRHLILTQVAKVNYGMFHPTFTIEKCKNLF